MAVTGVEYLQQALCDHQKDLGVLFKHNKIDIDVHYFDELNSALFQAENAIRRATLRYNYRIGVKKE